MIKLENVSKIYETKYEIVKAIDNINLTLPDKGLICLLGKSGSGKSTLLNLIGGLDSSSSGDIFYNNICLNKMSSEKLANYRNEVVGFVFQDFNLLNNLTVYENIKIVLDLQNKKNETIIEDILKKLDILKLKNRKIDEISGGQKARVAIARAIIKNPQIILADEPTGNLDQKNSNEVWKLLKKISKNKLVLIVSHDKKSAISYADTILNIVDGKLANYNPCVNEENSSFNLENYEYSKSLLKILYKKVFKSPKILFLLAIITMTLAMFFFGFSFMLTSFDINESHAEALVKNKENNISIIKNDETNSFTMGFNVSEVNYFESFLQNYNYFYGSNLIVNNEIFTFAFNNTDNITEYYKFYNNSDINNNLFVDIRENQFDYIGNIPKAANEIMISNFLADYIIRLGVDFVNDNFFKIDNYNDLLYQEILVHNVKFKISGIYLVDEEIKNKNTINIDDENLILQYLYRYYINPNFFKISSFNNNGYANKTIGLKYNDRMTFIFLEDENVNYNQIILGSDIANEQSINIGDKINIQLCDLYDLYGISNLSYDLEVIDIGNITSINSNLLKNINLNNQLIREIYINNANIMQLKKVLLINNKNISFKTIYSNDINNIKILINQIKTIFTFIGYILAFVNVLIVTIYIHFWFKSNKEKIDILYSLGIRESIIKKVFFIKTLMLGFITLVLSYILITLSTILGNLIISHNLGYSIKIIKISYISYIYPLLLLNVILLFSIAFQMLKIKKMYKKIISK